MFVSLGSYLRADLKESVAGYWIIANGEVDGKPVHQALQLVLQEHFVLLPVDYPADVAGVLTWSRLAGSRWTFGLSNRDPLSKTFFLLSNGTIGGYRHPNEHSWQLQDDALLILSEAGSVTWKFNVKLLQDRLLKLVGFSQQDWVECAILTEHPAVVMPVNTGGERREWISVMPTSLISTWTIDPNSARSSNKSVPRNARLVANMAGQVPDYWVINDASLDGEPLPDALCLAAQDDWVLLPADQPAATALLTASQLIGRQWTFGFSNREPISTAFYFLEDGKIGGYRHINEQFWELNAGVLSILNAGGLSTWKFEVAMLENELLKLIGFAQQNWDECAVLTEMPRIAFGDAPPGNQPLGVSAPTNDVDDDSVRMIIWDLDDTLWHGTLSEGDIVPISFNLNLIKEMNRRGIVNSVCSKNDFIHAKERLIALGVWDYIVFPKIAMAPKGEMIQHIIQSAQLRSKSVLFVDDNPFNIEEALHYNPGLQVCSPEALEALSADARCAGDLKAGATRLAWYKVLEKKILVRSAEGAGNMEFLRQSGIRISFHHDVFAQFERLHVLVNRTNQLNFMKHRWPENEDEARQKLIDELSVEFNSHCGYIKVADKYGTYGICGFYMVRESECHHLLFSCRIMNMGIEQFVWQKLGCPHYHMKGSVASTLGASPDWIEVVDDADVVQEKVVNLCKASICIRGACDLAMMTHYLRLRFNPVEEFTFPFMGWGIHPVARAIAVYDEANTPAGKEFLARMPGMSRGRFDSAVHTRESDIYILSFSSEVFCGLYRSKSTGMLLPLDCWPAPRQDFRKFTYDDIRESAEQLGLQESQWQFLHEEFEFQGVLDLMQLHADVKTTFAKLRGKTVIILMLSTEFGKDKWILNEYKRINSVVRPLTEEFGFQAIEMGELVRGVHDLVDPEDGGVHFKREVYQRLAKRVTDMILSQKGE